MTLGKWILFTIASTIGAAFLMWMLGWTVVPHREPGAKPFYPPLVNDAKPSMPSYTPEEVCVNGVVYYRHRRHFAPKVVISNVVPGTTLHASFVEAC